MKKIKKIAGGITAPAGYLAGSVCAGIRRSSPDVALIYSQQPSDTAAVFTSNLIKGHHIDVCQRNLKKSKISAIIINSGCANACLGTDGDKAALKMASLTADSLKLNTAAVLPCSTGTIGKPLPIEKIAAALPKLAKSLSRKNGSKAATAIMTTDTKSKQCAVSFSVGSQTVRIGGMAKGSGMIEPNMATMLAFITTDANIKAQHLNVALREAVHNSFNKISVDGDQSCNDTVILMANGQSNAPLLSPNTKDWKTFCEALNFVCLDLAKKIVLDGEGATKFVTVCVNGARNQSDARKAVRAVANSLLVKTSWFGGDPNWGRIIDAVGYSGAFIKPDKIDIDFDGVMVVRNGQKAKEFSLSTLEKIYRKKQFDININLYAGKASDIVYTCDCSYDYVKINADYMT